MRVLIAAAVALLPIAALAQSYPSPRFNNVTVDGTVTGRQSLATVNIMQRLVSAASRDNPRVNEPMMIPDWEANRVYFAGERVGYTSGGSTIYFENQFGPTCTSGAGPGPTTVSSSFYTDGTCLWSSVRAAPVGGAPTITSGTQWVANTSYPANAIVVTFSFGTASFYTNSGACTSAASGLGPSGAGPVADNTCTWTRQTTITGNSFTAAGANSYLWSAGAGRLPTVANIYGGQPDTNPSTNYMGVYAATVNGTRNSAHSRVEFVTDAPRFMIRHFDFGSRDTLSNWRIIVCDQNGGGCRYVSPNHYGLVVGGFGYTIVDFSAYGREPRNIIIENSANALISGIDVLAGDDVWKPSHQYPLSMVVVGDSYPAAGGVQGWYYGFSSMIGDILGVKNAINTAIGSCGYYDGLCTSLGQLTRIGDVTYSTAGLGPDVLLISGGSNDAQNGRTPAQVSADVTAYLNAIRASNTKMATMPIIHLGVYPFNSGTSCTNCYAVETAIQNAIASRNDSNLYFCPVINDPTGSWETGTGSISAQNGTGNTDYIFNTVNRHLNALGNRLFASRLASCIRNHLNTARY